MCMREELGGRGRLRLNSVAGPWVRCTMVVGSMHDGGGNDE